MESFFFFRRRRVRMWSVKQPCGAAAAAAASEAALRCGGGATGPVLEKRHESHRDQAVDRRQFSVARCESPRSARVIDGRDLRAS